MAGSERAKMAAGEWYTCLDDELEALRALARDAVFEHNCLPPRQRGNPVGRDRWPTQNSDPGSARYR